MSITNVELVELFYTEAFILLLSMNVNSYFLASRIVTSINTNCASSSTKDVCGSCSASSSSWFVINLFSGDLACVAFSTQHPGIIGYELVISVHEAFLKVCIINKFVLAGERAFYPVSLALPLENTPASPGMPAIRLTGFHICHSGY